MIIDAVSDLHGFYPKLEGGDLLIVAGDLTKRDEPEEYIYFRDWLSNQKYNKKIVIAGNHDNILELDHNFGSTPFLEIADYLCDSGTEITYYPYLDPPNLDNIGIVYKRKTLKIWGSPWTKWFPGVNPKCRAFMLKTEEELAEKWAMIPDDIDILVTHSPPYGVLDQIDEVTKWGTKQFNVGSTSLLNFLEYNIRPKLHIFGHIHENGGKQIIFKHPGYGDENNTICVNASIVNEKYEHVNKAVRIEL